MKKEGGRVATIVPNLRSFPRQETRSQSPAHLGDILNSCLYPVGAVLRKNKISVERDFPGDLPQIKCRSQQIEQVFMDLLNNTTRTLNNKTSTPQEEGINESQTERRDDEEMNKEEQ